MAHAFPFRLAWFMGSTFEMGGRLNKYNESKRAIKN